MIPRIVLDQIQPSQLNLMPDQQMDKLNILWNIGDTATLSIDGLSLELKKNCIVFLSEFYMDVKSQNGMFRLIQFDKSYLNPIDAIASSGEYLAIFYGIHSVSALPKIALAEKDIDDFETIWKQLIESQISVGNPVMLALVRNSLQRLLLLSQLIHMETEFDIPIDFKDLRTIREFQYLVNNNFKELTKVSQYAEILMISPKKISELFGCCYNRKASELIADRRNLYAKRQLLHTDELIKNIAYDLNFSDSQTFSHFFKKQNGVSPEEFRNKNSK